MKNSHRIRLISGPGVLFLLVIGLIQCNQADDITIPVVETKSPIEIKHTEANCGGKILTNGGDSIISSGICWSLHSDPGLSDSIKQNTNVSNEFSVILSNLAINTKYYFRAFASNMLGTGFGEINSFTTQNFPESGISFNPAVDYGIMSDIDGNFYRTVIIGDQTWMAENLRVTRYRDGSAIPSVDDDSSWKELNSGAMCDYNNLPSNSEIYGKLYNGFAAKSGNLCPEGWHVPTYLEWTTLANYLGGTASAGGFLKETGTNHWLAPNAWATNTSGFSALPAGFRTNHGQYNYLGINGFWWHRSDFGTSDAWLNYLNYNNGEMGSYYFTNYNQNGFSIRCVKD